MGCVCELGGLHTPGRISDRLQWGRGREGPAQRRIPGVRLALWADDVLMQRSEKPW